MRKKKQMQRISLRAEQYIECAIWGKNMKKMYVLGRENIGDRLSSYQGHKTHRAAFVEKEQQPAFYDRRVVYIDLLPHAAY
ncbi:hypothetical protein DVH26_03295 [Paenibacillus sp. H1-7]|nr:hypothetical protein DVH26_03295 [Paenibacillus sp. H1-7]